MNAALLVLSLAAGAAIPQVSDSPDDFLIFINYELGMHCTGFDFEYCCVLPPYNSIQAQVVRVGRGDRPPRLLEAYDASDPTILIDEETERQYRLRYQIVDNAFSEGGKMKYWSAPYDLNRNGNSMESGEVVANAYWTHLYVYDGFEGDNPTGTSLDRRKKVLGRDLQIAMDRGLRGQGLSGYLRSASDRGTIVFTKSPVLDNVPLMLTHPGIFEALALPLTPFLDSERLGRDLKSVTERDVQPFQKARVTLVDAATGEPIRGRRGQDVSFVGTEPIDIPNCHDCHTTGDANARFPSVEAMVRAEQRYWRSVGATDFYANLKAASISVLGLHDAKHGTRFTAHFSPDATGNRLGRSAVLCQKCHADNVIGVLASAQVIRNSEGALAVADLSRTDYALAGERIIELLDEGPHSPAPGSVLKPLSEAIHLVHMALKPLPDAEGRAGVCQGCHPAHRADRSLTGYPISVDGRNPYDGGAGSIGTDNRDAGGGCFVGRDVHSLISRQPQPSRARLNSIGRWLLENVARSGTSGTGKGLWCTNCHTTVSRDLYKLDRLEPGRAFRPTPESTIRSADLATIATQLNLDQQQLARALDPRVGAVTTSVAEWLSPALRRACEARGVFDTSALLEVYASKQVRRSADLGIILHFVGEPYVTPDDDGDPQVALMDPNPNHVSDHRDLGGGPTAYDVATHGRDYWLSAGEPHCADCHLPPFVEAQGDLAFPINQRGKYSLFRYSKGHVGLACQACHQSPHGLHPVLAPGVDPVTSEQARSLNPDGTVGPVRCGACHGDANEIGVPRHLKGTLHDGVDITESYDAAIAYMHATAADQGGRGGKPVKRQGRPGTGDR